MRKFLFFIFLFISFGIKAQIYIKADVTTGCNPLLVKFNIQPEAARGFILSYEWSFGDGKVNSLEDSTIHEFDSAGNFAVSCRIGTANDSFLVYKTLIMPEDTFAALIIKVQDCDSLLNIPNVFSPNDDNRNDFFNIDTNGTSIYYFSVYSRSGTLVYKSESPVIIWDGRSMSGQKMETGIYYYTIQRNDDIPLNEVKGFVYLFR